MERDDVRRIAELARLEVPDEALERVAAQLSSVLEFVATLGELDLADCAPSAFAPADAALRADLPNGRRLSAGAATAAAPETESHYFLVPPIVENVNP